jgi:hypothetical protein
MRTKVRIRHYLDNGAAGSVGHLEMNDQGIWHLVVRGRLDMETIQTALSDEYRDYFTPRQTIQGDRVYFELGRRPTVDFLCAVEDLARHLPGAKAAA